LKNFDLSDQLQFDLANISNAHFLFGEKWHFWPWTYPGNFLFLIFRIKVSRNILPGMQRNFYKRASALIEKHLASTEVYFNLSEITHK
jgi:hypothetical protein